MGKRYVLQTHGMVDPTSKRLAAPLDAAVTRRVLRRAAVVFYLTDREARDLRAVAGDALSLVHLPNGIAAEPQPPARGADGPLEVLFLARLHQRKRPLAFVAAATRLAPRFLDVRFRLVGPDEGEGEEVQDAIDRAALGTRLTWDGSATAADCRTAMERADLYVLPSIDEPFPMSVLEALSAGLPVIVLKSCGLAPAVEAAGAGMTIGEDVASLTEAIGCYLTNGLDRLAAGVRGAQLIRSEFAMEPILDRLIRSYSGQVTSE